MIPGLTPLDLKKLEVGDVIVSKVAPLAGLSKKETLTFTVEGITKSGLVTLLVTYFGVKVGEWAAKVENSKITWVNVMEARRRRANA